jgi:hypothetical protein
MRARPLIEVRPSTPLPEGVNLLHLPDSQDYIDAKREFETDQALLQAMRLQQIRATVAGEIQDESVISTKSPNSELLRFLRT